jgi:hypothetical protein
MNTEQLRCVLKEDVCLSKVARGVFAPDTLPARIAFYPSAYVCNTDRSNKPGKHWVALWFDGTGRGEFFDSFGLPPEAYDDEIAGFLRKQSTSYTINGRRVQDKRAVTCGYHVLFYLLMKCRNNTMTDIVKFMIDSGNPDGLVYKVVTEYFDCV